MRDRGATGGELLHIGLARIRFLDLVYVVGRRRDARSRERRHSERTHHHPSAVNVGRPAHGFETSVVHNRCTEARRRGPCKAAVRIETMCRHRLLRDGFYNLRLRRVGMAWLRREVGLALPRRGGHRRHAADRRPVRARRLRGQLLASRSGRERRARPGRRRQGALARARRARALRRRAAGVGRLRGGATRARARAHERHDDGGGARVERAWEAAERVVAGARGRSASFQAVHGDAHIRNVLATARGVLWTDWEDAFLEPIEFDLACLRCAASPLPVLGPSALRADGEELARCSVRSCDRSDVHLVGTCSVVDGLIVNCERRAPFAHASRRGCAPSYGTRERLRRAHPSPPRRGTQAALEPSLGAQPRSRRSCSGRR
ncbi:MAG: phosphotransferase [Labilithrix sp.]|nr:phosphotransferase [Labilithrix sp.]MCW5809780.1 phosphotransferase [Labilithrix sp.]